MTSVPLQVSLLYAALFLPVPFQCRIKHVVDYEPKTKIEVKGQRYRKGEEKSKKMDLLAMKYGLDFKDWGQ